MNKTFKRTKILATIGPSVFTEEKINELIDVGINGCRLNFSHGNYMERDQQIKWIREAAAKRGRNVAILQDLQGPKIRLGDLKDDSYDVKAGDELILDSSIKEHDGSSILPVQYNLAERMKVGEPLFIYDGKIKSEVIEIVSDTAIKIRIENEGHLTGRRGLNLPDTDFGGDIITEKDMADIEFGCSRDFDYVALSFVQTADDIEKLRQILISHGSTAQIVAKIETKKAIETDENLEAIVKATDGIMVARGDMAVEAGAEVVPIVQRKLINLCRKHSKLCIIATQMLGSMVDAPEPTRAEVSDVANAVMQGVDAVMLSDETAQGHYPVQAVQEMRKVILHTQAHVRIPTPEHENITKNREEYDAISSSAARLAEQLDADFIVCQTSSGATAAAIAAQRPNLPILSVTDSPRVAGQLALTYATTSFVRPLTDTAGLDLAQDLKAEGLIVPRTGRKDLTIVITSGTTGFSGSTDTIQIRKI